MRFQTKLILLLVLVAAVPVATSGLLSALANQDEMTRTISGFQRRAADLAARAVDEFFTRAVEELEVTARLIGFERFSPAELPDVLKIPVRQFNHLQIAALLDGQGQQLAPAAYASEAFSAADPQAREPVLPEDVEVFGAQIPFQAALAAGRAFGPAYRNPRTHGPRIALALAIALTSKPERWVLAVELSLREVVAALRTLSTQSGGQAFLIDGQGRMAVHPDPAVADEPVALGEVPFVQTGLRRQQASSGLFSQHGQLQAAAFSPIRSLGWGLVVAQPEQQAFAAARRIGTYTLFWTLLSLAIAVFGGVLFARTVSRPIARLAAAARQVAQGDFSVQLPVATGDEIGKLSTGFNQMSTELAHSFATIGQQKAEIEQWNQELQNRVEQRTRELKAAQAQIVRSQKLAAVSELAAGLAHEINNPLTGILGYAQLLLAESAPEDPLHAMMKTVVAESKRIHSIVRDLQRLSAHEEETDLRPLDCNAVLHQSLRMFTAQLQGRHIELVEDLDPNLPRVLGEASSLGQALMHLISNAITAMPSGGRLRLSSSTVEGGAVKMSVADTGRGIASENLPKVFEPFYTTKDVWSGTGLGLSVTHRIIEEHQGQIEVQSEVGKGTCVTLFLPGLPRDLHLR